MARPLLLSVLLVAGCTATAEPDPLPHRPAPAPAPVTASRAAIPWEGESLKDINWDAFAPKAPADRSQQFLSIAVPNAPTTWDPHKAYDDVDRFVARALFEGLVTRHPETCQPIPAIAQWWDVSPDRRVYTFHLRSDARWSDGTKITAVDVQWSIARALDADTDSPGRDLLATMLPIAAAAGVRGGETAVDGPATELQVVGERTLRITLMSPDPRLIHVLAEPAAVVVHRATVEAHATQAFEPEHWVSSGAFTRAKPEAGGAVLARNPNHWMQERAWLSGAALSWPAEEGSALLSRYESGAVDWVPWTLQSEIKAAWVGSGAYSSEGAAVQFLVINAGAAEHALASAELRRAMAISIDTPAVAVTLGGGSIPAERLILAALPGYPSIKPLQRSREAHARGPLPSNDTPLRFLVADYPAARTAAAAMTARWGAQLGLRAEVIPLKAGALRERIESGDFDVALAGHAERLPHPLGVFESPLLAHIWRQHAALRDALARSRAMPPAESLAALARVESKLVREFALVVPLTRNRHHGVINPRVQGLTPNVLNEHRLRYLRVRPAGD